MFTVLLPPGVNPIAVNKFIISISIYCRNWKGKHNGFTVSENGTVSLRRLHVFRNCCAEILSEEARNTTCVAKTVM